MLLNIGEICPIDWPATIKQKNVDIIFDALYWPGFIIIISLPMKKPKEYKPSIIKFIKPDDNDE